jgi:hypothetical protein
VRLVPLAQPLRERGDAVSAERAEGVEERGGAVALWAPVLTPEAVRDRVRAQHELLRAALAEGTDYGVIPGTPKPTLLKPGAEKLLAAFGFGHRLEQTAVERDADGRAVGVTYRCVVTKWVDGSEVTVASCDGYAGRDEPKWAKAPWNTVVKMAQKRALVGAALQATATSGLLTQDVEDAAPATTGLVEALRRRCRALPPEAQEHMREAIRARGRLEALGVEELADLLVEVGRVSAAVGTGSAERAGAGSPPAPGGAAGDRDARRRRLFALLRDAGLDPDDRGPLAMLVSGRRTSSTSELDDAEWDRLLEVADALAGGRAVFGGVDGDGTAVVWDAEEAVEEGS